MVDTLSELFLVIMAIKAKRIELRDLHTLAYLLGYLAIIWIREAENQVLFIGAQEIITDFIEMHQNDKIQKAICIR